jgi:hypothetical protein
MFAGHARRVAISTGLARAGALFRQSPAKFMKDLPGHLRRWWRR